MRVWDKGFRDLGLRAQILGTESLGLGSRLERLRFAGFGLDPRMQDETLNREL